MASDNQELFQYYSKYYKRAEQMDEKELMEEWFSGKYLENVGGKEIDCVTGVNQEFWRFQTDITPYLWYTNPHETVPGTD